MTISREEFDQWVHEALSNLYDSAYLETHPLARLLTNPETRGLRPSQALRRSLLQVIRILHPSGALPDQSPDWRLYRVLELRYVEGLPYTEVMQRLNLGKSQYFREQARALEATAAILWNQVQADSPEGFPAPASGDRNELVQEEIERLSAQADWEPVELIPVLNELRPMLERLARDTSAILSFNPIIPITVLHADRIMLRQMLLNLFTGALDMAHGGVIEFKCFSDAEQLGMSIFVTPGKDNAIDCDGMELNVSEELALAMKGTFSQNFSPNCVWEGRLTWHAAAAPTLLVIDDNEGIINLVQRYLAGSVWQVWGATHGDTARQILAQKKPTVIVLDVMMPSEDGWEWLVTTRNDETIRQIPVIMCSVLKEARLAKSLGAVDYLVKPVSQSALLSALSRWLPDGAILAPEP